MKDKKVKLQKSDVNRLQELSKVLTQYNLTAVEISENEKKYRVEKMPADTLNLEVEDKALLKTANNQIDTIASPVVGVFCASFSENEEPLVKVGNHFKEGDVLCVIEAMKTFTEIKANENGIIKEICAKNGDLVEYSQPLFKYLKQ